MLPTPHPSAQASSHRLVELLRERISATGSISFIDYMDMVLYYPVLGYYNNATEKLGSTGDFVTAPEISPLFGYSLANQIQPVLDCIGNADILEFGAGSGRLAGALIQALEAQKTLPDHYYIMEVSPALKARQRSYLEQKLPHLIERIQWLETLPKQFRGIVLSNEVLDAMPIHRFIVNDGQLYECGVTWQTSGFTDCLLPAPESLANAVCALDLPSEYHSEMNLYMHGWLHSISDFLTQGLVLIIDYGFPRREYYHPQRSRGTLMCHYQQHSHTDPYWWPGLQDMTSHVDFTALAETALNQNLTLAGYTTQSHFLLGCGITDITSKTFDDADTVGQYNTSQQLKKLLLPSEMGELFKVIAFTRGLELPLLGFQQHDMRYYL